MGDKVINKAFGKLMKITSNKILDQTNKKSVIFEKVIKI